MNLSRGDLAKRIGITRQYYGMIEAGIRKPGLDIALRIASVLGRPVEELFSDLLHNNHPAALDAAVGDGA